MVFWSLNRFYAGGKAVRMLPMRLRKLDQAPEGVWTTPLKNSSYWAGEKGRKYHRRINGPAGSKLRGFWASRGAGLEQPRNQRLGTTSVNNPESNSFHTAGRS